MAEDAAIFLAALLGGQGLTPAEAQELAVKAIRLNHNSVGEVSAKTVVQCLSAQDSPVEEIKRTIPEAREAERQLGIALQALNEALSSVETVAGLHDLSDFHHSTIPEEEGGGSNVPPTEKSPSQSARQIATALRSLIHFVGIQGNRLRSNRICFESGAYQVLQRTAGDFVGISASDLESFQQSHDALVGGNLPHLWCPETIVNQAVSDPGLIAPTLAGAMTAEDE